MATDWMNWMRGQERIAKTGDERVTERYSRIVIDLGTAREDKEIHISGDYLAVAKMNGTASTTKFRLNHRNSREIYPTEIESLYATYKKIYLTNAAEAGKELILYVGGALAGEIKVTAGKVGLKNTAGSDIDPVRDDHFIAHTGAHSVNALAVADTAEHMMAASTKVKWAIIYTDLAIRWGFVSTVHRTGPIGALLTANGNLALEYCDLYDVWFNNNVPAEQPKLQIEYVEEA